jgi:hypothetical protein
MALKLGAENKRNVIIVGALFCVLVFLAIRQLSGPSSPAPAPPPVGPRVASNAATPVQLAGAKQLSVVSGPEARKVANAGLDPSLHLEKLALSESIEYAGNGRNIFSAEAAPVAIPEAITTARNTQPAVQTPPPYVPPAPPQIDLKFFGYAAGKDGKKQAFLLRGDDIFEAAAGDIVNHRYKVVAVDARSVQVTDLSYNNTQTLALTAN